MKTIMVVGFAPHGEVAEQSVRGGFFALPAGDGEAARAILNAVCADGFVIDVGKPSVRGERLIDQLEHSERWRRMPIIAMGARPRQHMRLLRNGAIAEVITACERGVEAVVAAVRRAMNPSKPARPREDLPGEPSGKAASGRSPRGRSAAGPPRTPRPTTSSSPGTALAGTRSLAAMGMTLPRSAPADKASGVEKFE